LLFHSNFTEVIRTRPTKHVTDPKVTRATGRIPKQNPVCRVTTLVINVAC
jgi:hypothetical protein